LSRHTTQGNGLCVAAVAKVTIFEHEGISPIRRAVSAQNSLPWIVILENWSEAAASMVTFFVLDARSYMLDKPLRRVRTRQGNGFCAWLRSEGAARKRVCTKNVSLLVFARYEKHASAQIPLRARVSGAHNSR
jgi:hypothetical protein